MFLKRASFLSGQLCICRSTIYSSDVTKLGACKRAFPTRSCNSLHAITTWLWWDCFGSMKFTKVRAVKARKRR